MSTFAPQLDPENRSLRFVSWIPNLLGRISFRSFGFDTPRTAGNSESFGRYVIASNDDMHIYFSGYWFGSDSTLKNSYTDVSECRGLFYYQVYADAEKSSSNSEITNVSQHHRREKLVGKICFIAATPRLKLLNFSIGLPVRKSQLEVDTLEFARRFSEDFGLTATQRINAHRAGDTNELNYLNSRVSEHKKSISEFFVASPGKFIVNFTVDKKGQVIIEVPATTLINRGGEVTKKAYSNYDTGSIAITSFNIIRNKVHFHKHHSKTNDALVGVYPYIENDISWKYKIVSSLRRAMRGLHNDYREDMQSNAVGIGAYLATFGDLFLEKKESDDLRFRLNDSMNFSLVAKRDKIHGRLMKRFVEKANIYALLAVLIAVLSINKINPIDYFDKGTIESINYSIIIFISAIFVKDSFSDRLLSRLIRFGIPGTYFLILLSICILLYSVLWWLSFLNSFQLS
jgi:hypothetical protein